MLRPLHVSPALFAALLLAMPAPAQRAAPPALLGATPRYREFSDWLVACDNVRVCRAQVTGQDGSLMIRRDPGPDGAIVVVLDGQDPTGGPSLPDIASIRVEGGEAPGGWHLDRRDESAKLEGTAALAFVRAIANASRISYRAGAEALSVSLAGLTAALLAIDEAQGRLGTVTAFVRSGPRPVATVPPAAAVPILSVPRPSTTPPPPGFAAAVRGASAAALRDADCQADEQEHDAVFPLSESELLVFLGCRLYNTSYGALLLRAPRADPRRARIVVLPPAPGDEEQDPTGVYSDLEWDARMAMLSSRSHSCAGSCGQASQWTFDGRAFRLVEHLSYRWGGAEPLYRYRTTVRVRP